MSWEREDSVSSEAEFSEMVAAVTRYIHTKSEEDFLLAAEKVNSVRLKETGELFHKLQTLYKALGMYKKDEHHLAFTEDCLAKVIDQKRKSLRDN